MFCRSCLFFLAVVGFISTCSGNGSTQSLTFYSEPGCLGRNYTFTESNFNLSDHWVSSSTSYYIDGIWQVHFRSNPPGREVSVIGQYTGSCKPALDKVVTRLERFGALSKEVPEIILFPEIAFKGFRVYGTKDGLSFPRPIMIQSYIFTGLHSRTVFEELDYKGKSQCLTPSDETRRTGYGMNFEWEAQIPFGSIKYGCISDNGSGSFSYRASAILLLGVLAFTCDSN